MDCEWVRVCAHDEMLPGEFKVVWDGDTAIAVYNLEGDLYAVEDTCTHDGGELAGGDVCGFEVECPRHGARFDVRTGEVKEAPATEPIAMYTFSVLLENLRFGYGSALSVMIFGVTFLLALVAIRLMGRGALVEPAP